MRVRIPPGAPRYALGVRWMDGSLSSCDETSSILVGGATGPSRWLAAGFQLLRRWGSIPHGPAKGLSDGFGAMPCKHVHRGPTPRRSTTRRCSSKAERILGKDEGCSSILLTGSAGLPRVCARSAGTWTRTPARVSLMFNG